MIKERDGFSSKFGIIAAAAGSAIGLGNIWKFPYITGENGGGAFLLVYLICIVLIGLPILISEMLIGRRSNKNAVDSFSQISGLKGWKIPGALAMGTSFFILAFYGVVAGWTLNYVKLSLTNSFSGKSVETIDSLFNSFITNPVEPIIFQSIFMVITGAVVLLGVHNGIEKASKILMPFLLIIILILNVRAVTLDGASEGLKFLFKPDFSRLTRDGVLEALGHAFFTLSLGMGIMLTYGSYIKKDVNLGTTAVQVAIADTVIALLAGVAIFPAVFAFNIEPASGPGLVFITLPNIFNQMAGGFFFQLLFFILLAIAALTSTVSLLEVTVAYVSEDSKLDRKKSTIIVVLALIIIGTVFSLSMSPNSIFSSISIKNMNLFDFVDYFTANWMLPIVALSVSIFVGWVMKKSDVKDEISSSGVYASKYSKVFMIMIKFISPILIAIVFLNKVFGI
ncbi:sodium-dependent transporter [Thiospirochaeta perfilievii]|uniref:Transporter n=2 Tax=Thiospirochaeta perfilievii TaxID=252967 RepID=A0A5C1QE96_9SPIO|nr:sodium-dependent transporter [Thiospirochaeta perfilievii]